MAQYCQKVTMGFYGEEIVTMVWNWLKQRLGKPTSRKIKELEERIEGGEFRFFRKLDSSNQKYSEEVLKSRLAKRCRRMSRKKAEER
jgi:hypothetical protein